MPYVAFELDDYIQIKALNEREEKLKKFMRSAKYFGSDASGMLAKRSIGHNTAITFTPDVYDNYAMIRRLQNRRMVIIYGGICTTNAAFKAYETMTIHESRALGLDVKNIKLGEQLDLHITGYNTSEFGCAFVATIMEMLENPVRIVVTTAQHIQDTQLQFFKFFKDADYKSFIECVLHEEAPIEIEQLIEYVSK